MFCFEQGLCGETVRHIVDSCQHLERLNLETMYPIVDDGDAFFVIDKLGKRLINLVLHGGALTDAAYSYLQNCTR
jgi:hypothetical protein